MDLIKEAFSKIKEDITTLNHDISDIKKELSEIQFSILELTKSLENLNSNTSTHSQDNSTLRHINKTESDTSTHNSTDILPFQTLKHQYIDSSIGNEGVSTDRQTDNQTDRHIHNTRKIDENKDPNPSLLLEQLDSLKKGIRLKIKKLTNLRNACIFSNLSI